MALWDRRAQAGGGTALMWCWQSSKAGADGIWEFPFLALLLRPGLRGEGVWAHSSQTKERFPTPNRAESQGPVLEQPQLRARTGARQHRGHGAGSSGHAGLPLQHQHISAPSVPAPVPTAPVPLGSPHCPTAPGHLCSSPSTEAAAAALPYPGRGTKFQTLKKKGKKNEEDRGSSYSIPFYCL